jgi:HD-GYP domain-containing protein (c-di-GMP phosphodiesterase class II)
MPDHVALKIIEENAGSQFDPKIVNIFLKLHNRGEIKA